MSEPTARQVDDVSSLSGDYIWCGARLAATYPPEPITICHVTKSVQCFSFLPYLICNNSTLFFYNLFLLNIKIINLIGI